MQYDLIAPTAFGLEAVTARELTRLGFADVHTEDGRVYFKGDERGVDQANLWLRTAARVQIQLARLKAVTFEELFQGVYAIPWGDWLPENARFPMDGRSVKSTLFSISDCQAIAKKAVVEKLKKTYHRDFFEETGDLYRLEVSLLKDVVTVTLDTTGAGLHKRGYRKIAGEAPLKETMAAALIDLTFWRPGRILVDPMCGTGTIPIEAALIAENRAPGLTRTFVAEQWSDFAPAFARAREEAKDLIRPCGEITLFGGDIDAKAVDVAQTCARLAGVDSAVRFERRDMRSYTSAEKFGFLVTNPPYGERLGEAEEVAELYRALGKVYRGLDSWSCYVINAHPEFERLFGKRADKRRKLFNGRLPCQYYQYFGPKPPRAPRADTAEKEGDSK
jgi:putative N6-adenine-specific DNA methylase